MADSHGALTPVLLVGLGAAQLFVVAAWLPPVLWWQDLPNHGPQLAALGAGMAVALALPAHLWRTACVFAALALAHGLRAWSVLGAPLAGPGGGPTLRIVVANVLTSNTERDSLLAWLEAEQPDVIGLVEVDRAWLEALAPLREGWPVHFEHGRADNFGLALYARRGSLELFPRGVVPSMVLTDGDWQVMLTHPLPPSSARNTAHRDAQLRDVAEVLEQPGSVVVGDLNVTPWSHGFPVPAPPVGGGTWPTSWPAFLRVPIDHVLAGEGVVVTALEVGPDIGSDHLPLVATLELR